MMNTPRVAFAVAGEREQGIACPGCAVPLRLGDPVAVCQACGMVHHHGCWERHPACGSYACAPDRRTLPAGQAEVLKISSADLDGVAPLPPRRPFSFEPLVPLPPPLPRRNRLALAAFVTALAGIPLFGALTGLVAVLLGSLALGQLRRTGQKGMGLAFSGVLLGLVDVVGWIIFLTVMLSQPNPFVDFGALQLDPSALENLEPTLGRAMRANVAIEANRGLGARVIGSGVILRIANGDALVVTNRHVVDSSFKGSSRPGDAKAALPQVPVILIGQPPRDATVIWLAPHGIDLALLRVPCISEHAKAARWRQNRPLRVGESVFAIGNPLGLGWTHTQGVISQLRHQEQEGAQVRVIQTQTALNPGNSGGGLFDQEGFLIGINTWVKDKRVSEGLNFAIAFETLPPLLPADVPLPPGDDSGARR